MSDESNANKTFEMRVQEQQDKIEAQLEELVCLYCEKLFKSREVLKEHMRKKMHKKLNPKNKEWDKYYLVNYLESGKTWQDFSREEAEPYRAEEEPPSAWDDTEREDNEDSEWNDWRGEMTDIPQNFIFQTLFFQTIWVELSVCSAQ